jgi:hypothetical protein
VPLQGTPGQSWGTQPQVRPADERAQAEGNAWGTTGGTGGWPQSSLFAEQNQQSTSSRQFQQNAFGVPPGTGFADPNQSGLQSSFASFQQTPQASQNTFLSASRQQSYQVDPNQSGLQSSFASFQQTPQASQNTFLSASRQQSYQVDPNQSGLQSSFASFQQNPQASQNTFLSASRQQEQQRPAPWSVQNNPPARPAWMNQEDSRRSRRKGPGAGVVIVILVLLVLLLGGGAFAGYKVFIARNATATAPNPPTIATPSTPPLFRDTFQQNTANWDLTTPAGAKITLAGGKMVMESDNNKLYQEPFPGGKTYGDFRLDIDAGLTTGDPKNGYGVYVRGASAQDDPLGLFYRFEVYGDGYFYIYKGSLDANGNLQVQSIAQSQQPSDAVNTRGQMNHLTVIAQGSKLTWIINGTTVASLTDTSYKSGTMALFVSNVAKVPAGAQATFQNLAIFPAP